MEVWLKWDLRFKRIISIKWQKGKFRQRRTHLSESSVSTLEDSFDKGGRRLKRKGSRGPISTFKFMVVLSFFPLLSPNKDTGCSTGDLRSTGSDSTVEGRNNDL